MARLKNKHALITGGTRGIGEGIVRLFVAEGAKVVFTGRDTLAGESISTELDIPFRQLEITQEKDWIKIRDEFIDKPFDVLVNNAGGLIYPKKFHEMSIEDWHHEIDVNLNGPFLGIRTFLPLMLERGNGSIINIASISGVRAQIDGAGYQAAKAGLRWLTKNVAMTYATQGVRVNAINPGWIAEPPPDSFSEREVWFFDRIPMQRLGTPYEIASAAVFLASEESSYITGIDLDVDGGYDL